MCVIYIHHGDRNNRKEMRNGEKYLHHDKLKKLAHLVGRENNGKKLEMF